MQKPILKNNQVTLTGRVDVEATISHIEVISTYTNGNPYNNSSWFDIYLRVRLDNGYWFFTTAKTRKSVIGLRDEKGEGFASVSYSNESPWFNVIEKAVNYYDEGYKTQHIEDKLEVLYSVGDVIKVKGTVQKNKRLNRVVLLTEVKTTTTPDELDNLSLKDLKKLFELRSGVTATSINAIKFLSTNGTRLMDNADFRKKSTWVELLKSTK